MTQPSTDLQSPAATFQEKEVSLKAERAAMHYLNFGKQVRKDGEHFADAASDLAAAAICNAMNARAGGDGWRKETFNVNEFVWVKLTDEGRDHHRRWHTGRYPMLVYHAPDESACGWSKWQLWSLMQEFGSAMYLGGRTPFETGIRFFAPTTDQPA